MDRLAKNKSISETYRETKLRRQTQQPLVITCKVKKHMLNKAQSETLKMLFVESKWIYNHLLNASNDGTIDLFHFKMKALKEIQHFNKDHETVTERLQYTGSSMRDEILNGMCSSIKGLARARKNGNNIGALKFTSDYPSINLKQYGVTHKILSQNRIKVQSIKKPLPVTGLKQLKTLENKGIGYEFSNAHLIQKNDDYYIQLTIMVDRQQYKEFTESRQHIANDQLGIDFGCQTSFSLSTGEKITAIVEETGRLKRLQRKLARQKKGSNNYNKTSLKIRKEHERITNKKDDKANKFVAELLKNNQQVIIQDEQIKSWKKRHGKKVQHSILGRVKAILTAKRKLMPDRIFILNRFVPTTKLCSDCGHIHSDIRLWDREFICPECGVVYDRDIHAAQNMVWIHNNIVGADGTEFKREDFDV